MPSRKVEKKAAPLYRYVAVRVRPAQGQLWADGSEVRYFAVVSNWWELDGQALVQWQRGKAGTVEHTHHILTNELGAGVYPSAKQGVNAAWLRLPVLTHNLLELLKAVALPREYATARPKRLRLAVFSHLGQVVHHGRRLLLRLSTAILEALVGPGVRRIAAVPWDSS